MAESKDYLEKTEAFGKINISEEVIASIAAVSASEVEGVALLTSGSMDFAELLGKQSVSKSVKIQLTETESSIDIFAAVKYGVIIPSVAKQVQDAVGNAVESMAGLKIDAVNVHITGITFEKEPKLKKEKTPESE